MVKKKRNEFMDDALMLGGTSFGLGITGTVVTKAGGSAAPISTIAGFLPTLGVAVGGRAILKQVRKIKGGSNDRRKQRR